LRLPVRIRRSGGILRRKPWPEALCEREERRYKQSIAAVPHQLAAGQGTPVTAAFFFSHRLCPILTRLMTGTDDVLVSCTQS
jgi:hypothetical protein